MGKITVPKIIRPLDLREYADELEYVLQVWVNPPRELINRYVEIQDEIVRLKTKVKEVTDRAQKDGVGQDLTAEIEALDSKIQAMNTDLFAWFAEVWETETAEDVREFAVEFSDTDPALWAFISQRTVEMIRDHREGNRKN